MVPRSHMAMNAFGSYRLLHGRSSSFTRRSPSYQLSTWRFFKTAVVTTVFGLVMVIPPRIKTEERILKELFRDRYVAYQHHVSALGLPWQCLGFDGEMMTTQHHCKEKVPLSKTRNLPIKSRNRTTMQQVNEVPSKTRTKLR